MEIQFFPIDLDYVEKDNKAVIRIFGKTVDGKKVCIFDKNFEPYFWAIPKNKINLNKLIEKIENSAEDEHFVSKAEIFNKKYLGREVKAIKVIVNKPDDVPAIKDIVANFSEIDDVKEFDIEYKRRYLIDKKITPLMLCKVKGNIVSSNLNVDFCFDSNEIEPNSDEFSKPKVLCFDIETYTLAERYSNDEKDPIISLAFYGDGFKKIITWKKFLTEDDVIFTDSEADLINEFNKIIKRYKPDYLVGYYSDEFDFPYIKARADKYNIKLDLGVDGSNLKIDKRSNGAKLVGLVHLDIFKFITSIMSGSLQLDSYSLGYVAKELVNEEKLEIDITRIGQVWDTNSNEIAKICEYNLNDARLTYKVFEKILYNLDELTKLVGQPIFDICRMSYGQLVEWHLIKRSVEYNELCPNKPDYDEINKRRMHTYKGAFVFEPKAGLYNNLAVFDFKSLYPSVIVSHNICLSSLTKVKNGSHKTPDIIEDGKRNNYYFSYKEEGFIPQIIKDLIIRRNRIKEIIKKENNKILMARSYALKTVANATYGMYGFFGARWYCRECAASITAYSRDYITKVIERFRKGNFNVVYSDTDSIILTLDNKSMEDALVLLEKINNELPSLMELELEDFYTKGIFVMKKGELHGAKKKYALINSKGEIKVRGFETVRRNWSYLARNVQMKVLDLILREGSVDKALEYTKKIIQDVRMKRILIKEMVIRTQLKKDLKSYDQIGPHVKVAERMKSRGIPVSTGSTIKYVVIEGKGMIRERARLLEECEEDEYDSEYYINNQIIPSVRMIFDAVGYNEDELRERKEQSKLNHF